MSGKLRVLKVTPDSSGCGVRVSFEKLPVHWSEHSASWWFPEIWVRGPGLHLWAASEVPAWPGQRGIDAALAPPSGGRGERPNKSCCGGALDPPGDPRTPGWRGVPRRSQFLLLPACTGQPTKLLPSSPSVSFLCCMCFLPRSQTLMRGRSSEPVFEE